MDNNSDNSVKVVARFRPLNKLELTKGSKVCIGNLSKESVQLKTQDGSAYNFTFDRVFGTTSSQADVWADVGRPIVESLFNGFNGCLLAYGQTGSGKTHTMMGPLMDVADSSSRGIIPRAVDGIFAAALAADASCEFRIQVSFVEIYQERIRDLLSPTTPGSDNLQVGEEVDGSVYIKGVAEFYVTTPEEMLDLMTQGNENRAVSATGMNAGSSRSHSLFLISLTQANRATGVSMSGKLYLVDLAGSETVSKTGVGGVQLEELKKINKSLSALGLVINALTDGKSTHVPYRDSKLTRVLQECLGGNARTALIIACSPSAWNEMETLGTLRFGKRAKRITNHAHVNKELTPDEMKRRIAVLEALALAFLQPGKELLRLHGEGVIGATTPASAAASASAAGGSAAGSLVNSRRNSSARTMSIDEKDKSGAPPASVSATAAAAAAVIAAAKAASVAAINTELSSVISATAAAVTEATAALAGGSGLIAVSAHRTVPAPAPVVASNALGAPAAAAAAPGAGAPIAPAHPPPALSSSPREDGAAADRMLSTPGASPVDDTPTAMSVTAFMGATPTTSAEENGENGLPPPPVIVDTAPAAASAAATSAPSTLALSSATAAAAAAAAEADAASAALRLEIESVREQLAEASAEVLLLRTALDEARERGRDEGSRAADLEAAADEKDARIANLTGLLAATRTVQSSAVTQTESPGGGSSRDEEGEEGRWGTAAGGASAAVMHAEQNAVAEAVPPPVDGEIIAHSQLQPYTTAAAAAAAVGVAAEATGSAAASPVSASASAPDASSSSLLLSPPESLWGTPDATVEAAAADAGAAFSSSSSTLSAVARQSAAATATLGAPPSSRESEELGVVRENYRRALAENEELRAEIQDLSSRLASADRAATEAMEDKARQEEEEVAAAAATAAATSALVLESAPLSSSSEQQSIESGSPSAAAVALLSARRRPSAESNRIAAAALIALDGGSTAAAAAATTASSPDSVGVPPSGAAATPDGSAAKVAAVVPSSTGLSEPALKQLSSSEPTPGSGLPPLHVIEYAVVWEHQRLAPASGTWAAHLLTPGSADPPPWVLVSDRVRPRTAPAPSSSTTSSSSSSPSGGVAAALSLLHAASEQQQQQPQLLLTDDRPPVSLCDGSVGESVSSCADAPLPPTGGWYWTGEWEIDYGPDNAGHAVLGNSNPPERDGSGWQYASTFPSFATFRADYRPRGVRLPSDTVRRRRWVRPRSRVDVSSPEAATAHLLRLTGRLEAQDDLLVRMTDELGRRSKQIGDYENKLQDVLSQMALASATGDLRYIGGSSRSSSVVSGGGAAGGRVVAGGSPGSGGGSGSGSFFGGGARTVRGGGGGSGSAGSGSPAQQQQQSSHSHAHSHTAATSSSQQRLSAQLQQQGSASTGLWGGGTAPGPASSSYSGDPGSPGQAGGGILDSLGKYWRRLSAMPGPQSPLSSGAHPQQQHPQPVLGAGKPHPPAVAAAAAGAAASGGSSANRKTSSSSGSGSGGGGSASMQQRAGDADELPAPHSQLRQNTGSVSSGSVASFTAAVTELHPAHAPGSPKASTLTAEAQAYNDASEAAVAAAQLQRLQELAQQQKAAQQQLIANLFHAAEAGDEARMDACLHEGYRGGGGVAAAAEGAAAAAASTASSSDASGKALLMRAEDKLGRTAFLYAARGGRLRMCNVLLGHGADILASDKDGRNALHYAARRGHVDLARWLLQSGIPVRQADAHGLTPLSQAVLGKSAPMVHLLLASGADVLATDTNGMTARELAQRNAGDPAGDAVIAALTATASGADTGTAAGASSSTAAAGADAATTQ